MVGSLTSYLVLALVWGLAVYGMVVKLFFWRTPGRFGPVLYLVMGWLSVIILWPLVPVVPAAAIWLIAAGGLTYTAGVIFFNWESLKFSNAIWHGFVLAASACFYSAILIGTVA